MANGTGDYGTIITVLDGDDGVAEVKTALDPVDAEYLQITNTFFVHTDRKDKIDQILRGLKDVEVSFALIHIGSRLGAFVESRGMTDDELTKARNLINSSYNYG